MTLSDAFRRRLDTPEAGLVRLRWRKCTALGREVMLHAYALEIFDEGYDCTIWADEAGRIYGVSGDDDWIRVGWEMLEE